MDVVHVIENILIEELAFMIFYFACDQYVVRMTWPPRISAKGTEVLSVVRVVVW